MNEFLVSNQLHGFNLRIPFYFFNMRYIGQGNRFEAVVGA